MKANDILAKAAATVSRSLPSSRRDSLLNEAATAAGEQPRVAEAGTLFVAIAPGDEAQARAIETRFAAAGYASVEPDRTVYDMFAMQAHDRAVDPPGPFQVWMRQADTTQTLSSDDGTPEDLDRLLRELLREAGITWSMSMTAPDAKTRTFMMNTKDQAFDDMAALAAAQPDDIVLARTVIETATRLGRLTEAKQHLMRLRLAFPDEPDCRAAAAAVAIAEERYDAAIAILETVLEARPRDQMARVSLLGACQAAGHTQRAAALLDDLQSHGFVPKRQNPMPGNLLSPPSE